MNRKVGEPMESVAEFEGAAERDVPTPQRVEGDEGVRGFQNFCRGGWVEQY